MNKLLHKHTRRLSLKAVGGHMTKLKILNIANCTIIVKDGRDNMRYKYV
jgi:hypothetical protein